jgi:tetratricopeptide (TPR) repeat protein
MRTPVTVILALILASLPSAQAEDSPMSLPDIDSLWDYYDPAATRAKFEGIRSHAEQGEDHAYYLQLLTQIARTYGLEGGFDQAHALLDSVETELTDAMPLVKVRYLLERGRTFRSSGDPAKARPLFVEAYELGRDIGADAYAIDAAHMVALADTSWAKKTHWNKLGVELAEQSSEPRARNWRGSLYNNMGWDYHDHGEYDSALAFFEKALSFREEQGKAKEIGIAKWCIARALRSLERIDDALAIQLALDAEYDSTGQTDGYVYEELGELYLAKGDTDKAKPNFAKAYEFLSQDNWLVENEPERIERIKQLGGVE